MKLLNGQPIPGLGLGTFGSDKYSSSEVSVAVAEALELGYRHVDCASVYGNEAQIGPALRRVPREQLWVTSKVWNDAHDRVETSCEQTLRDLGLDVLDLYLVHWPFPNHHAVGVSVDARDPHAVPFTADRYLRTWEQMERLVHRGLVRHIGTSNMTSAKLAAVVPRMGIRPAANQLELHPHFQQPELRRTLAEFGIAAIGYSPIGSPSRPERDRTPEDTVDTEDPVVVAIARRLGVSPAIVCVLWQKAIGSIPIPFSVKRAQFEPMLRAFETLDLRPEDVAAIDQIDRGCRLIKGQVFLWPEAHDWRDLWDGEA